MNRLPPLEHIALQPDRVAKVVCLVLRDDRLLVFRQRDDPASGIQVPAGTINPGETPEVAALREAWEETGYRFAIRRKLGETEYDVPPDLAYMVPLGHERQLCHVYELEALDALPEAWSHLAEGQYWLDYEWWPLDRVAELDGRSSCSCDLLHLEPGAAFST